MTKLEWYKKQYETLKLMPDTPKEVLESWEKLIKESEGKMKRTIIIDTDENLVELLRDGYNIIESTIYDRDLVARAKDILGEIVAKSEIR